MWLSQLFFAARVWPSDANRANDRYQKAVLDSLKIESADEVGFVADCENLVAANQVSRKQFERHLATHPGWRVFTENGKRFATRRWAIEHAWKYSLHGYYTDHDRPSEIDFQTRLTIGLNGVPWARNLNRATTSEIGEFVEPASSFQNDRYQSHVVLSEDDLAIEILEESPSKERVMTKARHQTKKRTFGENHKAEAVWPSFTLWAICLALTSWWGGRASSKFKRLLNLSFNFYLDLFDWTG